MAKEASVKDNNSVRTGIYIDKNLLARCDENISRTNAGSRSEFISDAIEMYLSWLNSKETSKILTPALESVIGGKIATTENHIARVLFKQSVEIAMMMHVVAGAFQIDKDNLDRLRGMCVDEVSRLGGKLKFEDAVRIQKG